MGSLTSNWLPEPEFISEQAYQGPVSSVRKGDKQDMGGDNQALSI